MFLNVAAENGNQFLLHAAISTWRGTAKRFTVRSPQAPQLRQQFLPPRIYFAVTAVAHFTRRRCDIEFSDPLSVEHISIGRPQSAVRADLLGSASKIDKENSLPQSLMNEKLPVRLGA